MPLPCIPLQVHTWHVEISNFSTRFLSSATFDWYHGMHTPCTAAAKHPPIPQCRWAPPLFIVKYAPQNNSPWPIVGRFFWGIDVTHDIAWQFPMPYCCCGFSQEIRVTIVQQRRSPPSVVVEVFITSSVFDTTMKWRTCTAASLSLSSISLARRALAPISSWVDSRPWRNQNKKQQCRCCWYCC